MKILLTANVQLNASNNENLNVEAFHKWQDSRQVKLSETLEKARIQNARTVFLLGTLFGRNPLPEKVADGFFSTLLENRDIQVYAFTDFNEYQLISYRNDIPGNLKLMCIQATEQREQDSLSISINEGIVEVMEGQAKGVIEQTEEGCFVINGNKIPSFEPTGFEDERENEFGYLIWDTAENQIQFTHDQKYQYQSLELKIIPEDTEQDIIEKINQLVKKSDIDTFLRITITGKTAFGLTMNAEGLMNKLEKRFFSVKVFDNSSMDIEEEMFETDISLRSEFVRLALQDDSLSEGERNQIISCGWNALHGKGLSEE